MTLFQLLNEGGPWVFVVVGVWLGAGLMLAWEWRFAWRTRFPVVMAGWLAMGLGLGLASLHHNALIAMEVVRNACSFSPVLLLNGLTVSSFPLLLSLLASAAYLVVRAPLHAVPASSHVPPPPIAPFVVIAAMVTGLSSLAVAVECLLELSSAVLVSDEVTRADILMLEAPQAFGAGLGLGLTCAICGATLVVAGVVNGLRATERDVKREFQVELGASGRIG